MNVKLYVNSSGVTVDSRGDIYVLAISGLTERESEEFIIYWLPELETNKYNYIKFTALDEINKNSL